MVWIDEARLRGQAKALLTCNFSDSRGSPKLLKSGSWQCFRLWSTSWQLLVDKSNGGTSAVAPLDLGVACESAKRTTFPFSWGIWHEFDDMSTSAANLSEPWWLMRVWSTFDQGESLSWVASLVASTSASQFFSTPTWVLLMTWESPSASTRKNLG